MRLIIDVSKEDYKEWTDKGKPFKLPPLNLYKALLNATPIPDNATNIDVFISVFDGTPDMEVCPIYCISKDDKPCPCGIHECEVGDWWNAPYKKGGTESEDKE